MTDNNYDCLSTSFCYSRRLRQEVRKFIKTHEKLISDPDISLRNEHVSVDLYLTFYLSILIVFHPLIRSIKLYLIKITN